MNVYRVSAAHSDNWQLIRVPASTGRKEFGVPLGTDWTVPELILMRNRAKAESDFWDYNQGEMFAVSDRVAGTLAGEEWCELVPVNTEVTDSNGKAAGRIARHLLNVVTVANVIDPARTNYKPYGEGVLDFDQEGAIMIQSSKVPVNGIFLQPSGNWREMFCTDDFKTLYETAGWSGLRFNRVWGE